MEQIVQKIRTPIVKSGILPALNRIQLGVVCKLVCGMEIFLGAWP